MASTHTGVGVGELLPVTGEAFGDSARHAFTGDGAGALQAISGSATDALQGWREIVKFDSSVYTKVQNELSVTRTKTFNQEL